jgi:hypothetical protein
LPICTRSKKGRGKEDEERKRRGKREEGEGEGEGEGEKVRRREIQRAHFFLLVSYVAYFASIHEFCIQNQGLYRGEEREDRGALTSFVVSVLVT